jgi:exonuclease VII small subunit
MKTAVEWLYNNLKSHFEHNGDLLEVVQMSFEQAKEMEKEQIIDAFEHVDFNLDDGLHYYNQTFNYESNT